VIDAARVGDGGGERASAMAMAVEKNEIKMVRI
jgi:hypothetical protein